MVSIIFLSSHALELTKACIEAIELASTKAAQNGFKAELIVGYQNEDRRMELEQMFQKHTASHFKLVHVPLAAHVPQARNILLKLRSSHCKWILFIDDDVEVPSDYFNEFLNLQRRWPNADLFGGPNLTPSRQNGLARDSGRLLASRLNFICSHRYGFGPEGERLSSRDFILCNLFVRADVNPNFDLMLPFGEELGLIRNLIANGTCCVYSPSIPVFHFRREKMGQILAQMEKYGLGRGLAAGEDHLIGKMETLTLIIGLISMCAALLPAIIISLVFIDRQDQRSSPLNWLRLISLIPTYYLKGLILGYVRQLQAHFGSGNLYVHSS